MPKSAKNLSKDVSAVTEDGAKSDDDMKKPEVVVGLPVVMKDVGKSIGLGKVKSIEEGHVVVHYEEKMTIEECQQAYSEYHNNIPQLPWLDPPKRGETKFEMKAIDLFGECELTECFKCLFVHCLFETHDFFRLNTAAVQTYKFSVEVEESSIPNAGKGLFITLLEVTKLALDTLSPKELEEVQRDLEPLRKERREENHQKNLKKFHQKWESQFQDISDKPGAEFPTTFSLYLGEYVKKQYERHCTCSICCQRIIAVILFSHHHLLWYCRLGTRGRV